MRVAIIHHQFKLKGGMETYLLNLIKGFNDQQDQVSIYVYKRNKIQEEPICNVKKTNLFWLPRTLRKYWFGSHIHKQKRMQFHDLRVSLMRSFHQEIIVCGGTHQGFVFNTQKKITLSDRLEIACEKKSYATSLIVLAHSDQLKKELIELYSVPAYKILMVHPPINTEKFHQGFRDQKKRLRKKFNIHPEKKIILFPSTGHRRKGFFSLIAAFKQLPEAEFELVIAGNKPHKNSCANINYVGFAEDMASLYSACDVTILPSLYEPFGLAVPESLQCGTPVIISKFVGAKDLITEDEGIILADITPATIANAILEATSKQYNITPHFAERNGLAIETHIQKLKQTFRDHSMKTADRKEAT
ncbi:MAG: glycosyltransferase family 4 protein [Gammaproteobacteria bacterium]|nr:glycosyltransferase family 4 protein [Gammaproteobacteria bacterium]